MENTKFFRFVKKKTYYTLLTLSCCQVPVSICTTNWETIYVGGKQTIVSEAVCTLSRNDFKIPLGFFQLKGSTKKRT